MQESGIAKGDPANPNNLSQAGVGAAEVKGVPSNSGSVSGIGQSK